MKVGITGLCTPTEWSAAETFANIRNAGYTAYEPALRDTGWFSLACSDRELKTAAAQARDAGIELVSICPGVRSRPKDLMTADDDVRKASVDTVRECMRIASVTGVDTMLLNLGALTPELYYGQAYANALDAMRKLGPMAEDMGVRLAIEYVWNKFLLSPMEFNAFCNEVDSPNVGFYFDPGNMAIFGFPEHWVRICGKHLMAVHMKDFKRKGYRWTPLLEGDVNFPAVMRELRAAGYDGPLVSEVPDSIASFADTAAAICAIVDMG